MQSSSRPRIWLYAAAPLAALVAFAVRSTLEDALGHDAPLLVFVLAVAAAAIIGGLGPGLVGTAIGLIAIAFSFEPRGTLEVASRDDYVRIAFFVMVGVVTSLLGQRRLRLEQDARAQAARAEAALARERDARAEAERLAQLRDEFVATVSHELRTPLNAILGWTQMLLAAPGSPPERTARGLEVIQRNARAQAQLVEDLLDASRLVTGEVRLEVGPVQLDEVVREAIETVRPAASARGILLVTHITPARVRGDARRLGQVVWNLLANAAKFGRPGGEIRVSVEANDRGEARVEVADDGQGIAPEFLPFVFEKFRQQDASLSRKHAGLGLGLAIVRRLTELHGGCIEARSEGIGKGATFTLSIPLALTENAAEGPHQVTERPERLTGTAVLVVDDDPDALETAAEILERAGARVVRASSAAEALDAFERGHVGIVVLDLMMPDTDGFAVLRDLRARGADVPVIALTALAFPADRDRTRRAGFSAHLTKPIESEALVRAVASSAHEHAIEPVR